MKHTHMFVSTLAALGLAAGVSAAAKADDTDAQAQVAVTPPIFLQLEITSACTNDGAVFKIINRGNKWPRAGVLRLYHADDKSLISERRLRLGEGQKVSFIVKEKVSQGRPVAVWVEPEWYKREFEYDARITCP